MGRIEITTEPHELIVDGTTILMQSDPTASPEWDSLLEVKWSFKDAASISKSVKDLTDALASLAHTPEDADTLRKLNMGLPTLKTVVTRYVEVVVGFPTQPPATSTKGSKTT